MSSSLLSTFAEQLARDSTFPVVERGDRRWTRAALQSLSETCIHGAPPDLGGTLVGLRCANGPGFLAGILAIRRLGAAVLPFDAGTRNREAERILRALGGAVLLTLDVPFPDAACGSSPSWVWRRMREGPNRGLPLPRDLAVVKLTSGSSGEARAIAVPEPALLADEAALFSTMKLGRERVLTTIPLSHSYGLSSVAVPALRRDFTLVLPDSPSPLATLRSLRHADITFFPSAPAWLAAVTRLASGGTQIGKTRLVISAGAPLAPGTATAFLERFGSPIRTFYGASECGGIAFDHTGEAGLAGAIGDPVDGVEIDLVEPADGGWGPVADGESGLVRVRSDAVAPGELRMRDGDLVVEQSDRLGSRGFVSSDIAEHTGHGLRIVGRQDDVLNLRGRKVHPREVERVLLDLRTVRDVHVWAESATLKALVEAPASVTRAEVLRWCRDHLADYKVPRALTIVDRLPRTERGKLDRARLRELMPRSSSGPEESGR